MPQTKSRPNTPSKYGVAVRVKGIDGKPYVVLKDGQRGDSYGVQLRTNYSSGYGSLPRRRDMAEAGVQWAESEGEGGPPGALRRAQSHGSLLDKDGGGSSEDFHLSRPPGDGKSGSYGHLDGSGAVRRDRGEVWGSREGIEDRRMWDQAVQGGYHRSVEPFRSNQLYPDPRQQANEPPSHQTQPPVNRQIKSLDGGIAVGQQGRFSPTQPQHRSTAPVHHSNPHTPPQPSSHRSLGHGQAPGSRFPGPSANQWASEERRHVDLADSQVRILIIFFFFFGRASQQIFL